MTAQYKENIFSTEALPVSHPAASSNKKETKKPNIDHLIKRILSEKRRKKKYNIFLGITFFSIFLIFYFFIS